MVKIFNENCRIISVYIKDEYLFQKIANHHLTYRANGTGSFYENNCVTSVVAVKSVLEDVEKMTNRNPTRENLARVTNLKKMLGYNGLIYVTLTSEDVFEQTEEFSGLPVSVKG